ncbi:hypothetical protein [Natronomonas sp.]|uniref:hypothetical protein n=1 Tax=Natronomonas sp. TaxID=2184060 RepID=UPI002FC2E63B
MKRRRLLSVAAVAFVPGCLSSPDDPEDSTPEAEVKDVESYLPEAGEGWTLAETYEPGLGETGLTDAVVGKYRSPDDVRYDVLVVFSGTAEQLIDAGWQIAVPIENGAIAASTGQEERSPTPEHPPQPSVDGTPIPGTDDQALELLARSPELTESEVETNCMPC